MLSQMLMFAYESVQHGTRYIERHTANIQARTADIPAVDNLSESGERTNTCITQHHDLVHTPT